MSLSNSTNPRCWRSRPVASFSFWRWKGPSADARQPWPLPACPATGDERWRVSDRPSDSDQAVQVMLYLLIHHRELRAGRIRRRMRHVLRSRGDLLATREAYNLHDQSAPPAGGRHRVRPRRSFSQATWVWTDGSADAGVRSGGAGALASSAPARARRWLRSAQPSARPPVAPERPGRLLHRLPGGARDTEGGPSHTENLDGRRRVDGAGSPVPPIPPAIGAVPFRHRW